MATAVDGPRQLLLDSLLRVGYRQEHVELDWPYVNLAALAERRTDTERCRLDIAAFDDDRRHDWETTAVVCDLKSPDALASADAGRQRCRILFDATAAPNVLFGGPDTVDLWLRCETTSPRRVPGIGFNARALRNAFDDNRDSLERESLSRLRGGQRYLFDRVYDARRDQLADFMHVGLEQAIRSFRGTVGESISKSDRDSLELSLSHVAMALLAARIMEDKDFLGKQEEPSSNARRLIERAESASNGFFRYVMESDLSALDRRLGSGTVDTVVSHIMAYLTGPACFSLIKPDMLGDLYERALVANDRVGRNVDIKGIHYTPLTIAQHILRRIPIEQIPPSQRCILDPACGSGSFLMAATARLRDAFDANESDAEDDVLEHLRARVIGNDVDNIARLVTRMRYLLHHWTETGSPDGVPTPQLMEGDGLELQAADFGVCRPSVIVGNPPYVEYSRVKREYSLKGYETETCGNLYAFVLETCFGILSPYGRVGMIVPLSLVSTKRMNTLQNLTMKTHRDLWLSLYDVYPCKLFEGSKQRLSILISSREQKISQIFSTRYNRWKPEERDHLIQKLEYGSCWYDRNLSVIPKLPCKSSVSILQKLNNKKSATYRKFASRASFYVHRIPYNYVKAFDFEPYFWNEIDGRKKSEDYKPYYLKDNKYKEVVLAILNSNVFFWWWYTLFEGYHCGRHEVQSFPVGLDDMPDSWIKMIKKLASSLMRDVFDKKTRKTCQYKNTGKVVYDEFYPRLSKSIINEIDRFLAEHYEFTDDELDFIINYDIKYRT